MLIKLLVEERRGSLDGMTKDLVSRAKELRGKAETAAGKGDHAGAIRLLEDSTAELVKAIRNAGIYIPG
jgi:hypothetical protein